MIINKHEFRELNSEVANEYLLMNLNKLIFFDQMAAVDWLNKSPGISKDLELGKNSITYKKFKLRHAKTVDNPEAELFKILKFFI
jgi:hypothetical protein